MMEACVERGCMCSVCWMCAGGATCIQGGGTVCRFGWF